LFHRCCGHSEFCRSISWQSGRRSGPRGARWASRRGHRSTQSRFSCLNGVPGVSCSFSPASAQLPANGSIAPVLTIQVTSNPQAAGGFQPSNDWPRDTRWLRVIPFLLLSIILANPLALKSSRNPFRSMLNLASAALATFFLAGLLSCGGGSGGGSQGGGGSSGGGTTNSTTVDLQVHATSSTLTKVSNVITVTVPD